MDGEEDEFMPRSHSDDGGGTPVQDEHPQSDAEEAKSDRRQSEDEGINDETAQPMDTSGAMSDSEGEIPRKDQDEDSENELEKDQEEHSDNEIKGHDPSNDMEQMKELGDMSGSDEESPEKHRSSVSEDESPSKQPQSDQEEDPSSSPKRRGSMSDAEEGGDVARETENANKITSDSESEKHDSDSDRGMRKKKRQLDSDDEETVVERGGEERGEKEGEGESGKWKGVMQSDSEEEEGERMKAKSEGEQNGGQKDSGDEDDRPVKRKKAILSDSEDEEEEKADEPVKRSRAVSDGEDSDSASSVGPDKSLAAKLRELGSASEDEEETKTEVKKDEKALFGSDSDSAEDEEEKMIADIFGESGDEEEEEFTGFNQEDLEQEKKETPQKKQQEEDSDSDEGVDRSGQDISFMSDFDIMLAKRKAMNSKRRKHRDGGTFISDADDVVSAMINKMNEAAEEDRSLNSQKKPALKKLTLLPQVVMHLKKQDLKETFIDSGVMSAIKEWISPLPDKSLPALRIREELLRILQELPSVSQETLKHSGIGRAVMFLYKHPKESRTNKDLALKLINEWSRPIFGLTSNYKGMTREERQQRDLDQQMPQRRRLSSGGQTPRRDLEKQLTGEEKALRPGDPGFCARARVPMPSNKDYVVRPKWNVEGDSSRFVKKGLSLLEKHKRCFAEERKQKRPQGAVKISIEGNRMPL
ncbi:protein IWS1 homolog isoform X2 [Periophthalmus magnuspinnatus]|uniref:protein IWS1 homolog isoform X2 n=1 Tax=Periophthalmus magnuspinnatus TaxID=409849 RepID=UPI00243631D8|nr:protein IWS1 homolog isoform X2 [Periophthalmus magnuspinnatus]XP_055082098.1 protein IWS1 homolog isoform X2 [Periophthalmus magnuspinnatus]